MKITTITGHLTATEKRHISEMFRLKLTSGKVNRKFYHIAGPENGIFKVTILENDRGIGLIGGKIRLSSYQHTFKISGMQEKQPELF